MSIERMLTIKRVPTVLSNYQENASSEDLESKARGCDRNCLGKCCFPGIFLHFSLLIPVSSVDSIY